jgi:sarcosine oxidase
VKTNSFDVIVIGVGSMGSSACYFLSQRGYKVLGLEQFDISHEFGSHAGQSRIIRKAYFEHSDYVPLLIKAYENWKQLEQDTGTKIYFRTGLVYYGSPEHPVIKGVKTSAALYDIDVQAFDMSGSRRFLPFQTPDHYDCLFEPDAGFLKPEKSIQLYVEQARKYGADIHVHEKVLSWTKAGDGITVITDKNTYHCNKLVIATGAWAGKMIPSLANKIKITRQFVAWIKTKNEINFSINHFPCWLIADDVKPGAYYGFPLLPTEKFGAPAGLKLAHHHPNGITDPDHVNRQTTKDDEENLEYFLHRYLPGEFLSFLTTKICLYANTPDENFIIDKLPGYEDHVTIACGFSGHGFKFVSVVGEILADLAVDGKTELPIEFLSAKRFGSFSDSIADIAQ